jgi:RNA polymerase sigma-70 factor (ECF subfamily)
MTDNRSDISRETLLALRSGEEWAYNEVYDRYAVPLREFLAALIRNDEDAQELNHDVFLSLWEDREKIVPESGIKRFLYMRAKNLAMKCFSHREVIAKYEEFCRNSDIDYAVEADGEIIARETQILTEIVLRGMSWQRQTIYRMRNEEGRSIQDIANELNLSPSTVKNNLVIINKSIREVVSLFLLFFLS